MARKIYIAATNQHIGKTTTTLGLSAVIQKMGYKTGYCKPVGQECVDFNGQKVDKDAFLFSKVLGFDLDPNIHNPVRLPRGTTIQFLDNPNGLPFSKKLHQAVNRLDVRHDVVVFEGTGHPAVGSVVGLSNAVVARKIGASVILIVEGGIGNTIDRLELSMALFREQGVPIAGVIINKVLPNKLGKVRYYVEGWLKQRNIPLLGLVPFEKSMTNPNMNTIMKAVDGIPIVNHLQLSKPIEGIMAASSIEYQDLSILNNQLLVVNINQYEKTINKLIDKYQNQEINQTFLGGILILTNTEGKIDLKEFPKHSNYFNQHHIPIITSSLDGFDCCFKINNLKVKINPKTSWKVDKAIQLFEKHIDLTPIFQMENCLV